MGRNVKFNTGQSIAEVAYLAGIIDGEGCFFIGNFHQGVYGTGRQWHSLLKIVSCDEIIILWLEKTFGGSKDSRYRWTSKKKFYRPVYNWQATGTMLDYILPLILPYLVIKRPHCEVMLKYRTTSKNIGSQRLSDDTIRYRAECLRELRQLNSRFHDHPLKNNSALSP
jgi:hypothetical protein